MSTYFEEELTALTDWKRSIIGSSTEGSIKLYHEVDASGVKSISISERQFPFSTVFIKKHDSKPRYMKRSFQKVGSIYPVIISEYDVNSHSNKTEVSWGLTHSEYLIRAISPQLKCAIMVNLKSGSEDIKVVEFGAASAVEKYTIPLSLISFKDAASSDLQLGITDDCQVLTHDSKVYHYQSDNGAYGQDTIPDSVANPSQVFSPDYQFMVANNGVFKYNPTTRTYDLAVTKTFKKNKKIWNTNNKLLVQIWSDANPTTSIVAYDVFAMSIVNNTVYTQIPSNSAFVMTGNSYANPP